MATNDEINGWFGKLKEVATTVMGEELEEDKRKLAQDAAVAALSIVESVVIDINNIAFYMRERYENNNR